MATVPGEIPEFGETQDEAYRALGLTWGLETHQQLLTERKLFCRCPAGPYRNDFDAEILRHLRPTLSEMGRFDPTALMEKKTKKEIIYQVTGDTTCTYEMDDAPPFALNQEALDIAVSIALLFGANIVGELRILRKQYLDGSIPTGFQRTGIVGLSGGIPVGDRRLRIDQIALEEDSCREIEDRGHLRIFRTDRLSRPLVEVVTEPEQGTPAEAAEAGCALARALRGTGLVRTGIGAMRQDVNVSISGGTRVEIKGVPRVRSIARLVHYEAYRQRALLDLRDRLGESEVSIRNFRLTEHPAGDLAADFESPARECLAGGGEARLLRLTGFCEALAWPVGPHRTFADELADMVRVVACLDGRPNHLREGGAGATGEFWKRGREASGAGDEDGLLLLWGPAADLDTATEEIEDRCRFAFGGVMSESRQALPTGETRFERILPGPDRMYPDTDLPPSIISDRRIVSLRARLPEPVWNVEERMRRLDVPGAEIASLAVSPRAPLFFRVVERLGVGVRDAARFLGSTLVALSREGYAVESIPDGELSALLRLYAGGAFPREAARDHLVALSEGGKSEELTFGSATDEEVAETVAGAVASAPRIADGERRARHLMGVCMSVLRGRAPGAAVRDALERAPGERER